MTRGPYPPDKTERHKNFKDCKTCQYYRKMRKVVDYYFYNKCLREHIAKDHKEVKMIDGVPEQYYKAACELFGFGRMSIFYV